MKQAQADIYYENTVNLFNAGKFPEMLNEFFKAIRSRYDIEKPIIRRFISRKLNIINKLKRENEDLQKQIQKQQDMLIEVAEEYYELGNMCITDAHDPKAALANYDKALKLNPKFADALIRKGITLADIGDHHEACACYNKVLEMAPGNFKAWYNRGKSRLAQNLPEEAANDFDKATSLKPKNANAHEKFGDALSLCGKEEEAALQWAIAEQLRKNRKNASKD